MKSKQKSVRTGLITPLVFLCFFTGRVIHAQNTLWGMSDGGSDGKGAIFHTSSNGGNSFINHNFTCETPGSFPIYTKLCKGDNGKLYGLTSQGGRDGHGVLFEYDPVAKVYTKKHQFLTGPTGMNPYGSLIQAGNGMYYGMTTTGGANINGGVLFEYNPTSKSLIPVSTIFDFRETGSSGSVGSMPYGGLIQVSNKLYGLTSYGGIYNRGVMFEFDLITRIYSTLFSFNGVQTGANPMGDLLYSNGKLYGLTRDGGTYDAGVLFEYDINTFAYTKKIDFNPTAGTKPSASLIAANGKLYGVTDFGGANNEGTLFNYNTTTNIFTKECDFNGTLTGGAFKGSLMMSGNGKMYGTTYGGGTNGDGVLYEYVPGSGNPIIKVNFSRLEKGGQPYTTLIELGAGKFWGATSDGGLADGGVIFEYDLTENKYSRRVELNLTVNGSSPGSKLYKASNGKFYGVATAGGVTNEGVLFEYDPTTSSYVKKKEFNGTEGSAPMGPVVAAPNGKLYGMASYGGTDNRGVIYEYTIATGQFAKKLDFGTYNGTVGEYPSSGFTMAGNGKFYALIASGGLTNEGVLIEYIPGSTTCLKKVDFTGPNGRIPKGNLSTSGGSVLYGVTSGGGTYEGGTLFSYNPGSSTVTVLYSFIGGENDATGKTPLGGLVSCIVNNNPKLYGLTSEGGTYGGGVIFEFDLLTGSYTKKADLTPTLGLHPKGSFTQSVNGKLYATTSTEGAYGFGTIIEYDPIANSCIKTNDFDIVHKAPTGDLIEVVSTNNPKFVKQETQTSGIYPNPFQKETLFKTEKEYKNALLIIRDISGNTVKTIPVAGTTTVISAEGLSKGMYIYTLQVNDQLIETGKLVVE